MDKNVENLKITYEPGWIIGDPFEDQTNERLLSLEKRITALEQKSRKTEETNA
jgi:hypothetical protein